MDGKNVVFRQPLGSGAESGKTNDSKSQGGVA